MKPGNGIEVNLAALDYNLASDEELRAAREQIDAVGIERGLWVPEGAGQLVVAETVAVPADLRDQILANAETDIEQTNRVFEIINAGRRKNKRFDITPAGEQREKLQDQLTDGALEATAHLHTTAERPLMVVPALPDAITAEELVTAIDKSSRYGIYGWAGRPDFLKKFSINALTGYDEKRAESGAMTLIETGYDESREGTRDQQLKALRAVQQESPEVGTAPILDTASLGQRYNGQPNSWLDTYTRAIEVEPVKLGDFDCVVFADVYDNGRSGLYASDVQYEYASRRQVGLKA